MYKKKIGYGLFIIFIIFLTIYVYSKKNVKATSIVQGIDNFPESYRPYLEELQKIILIGHLQLYILIWIGIM